MKKIHSIANYKVIKKTLIFIKHGILIIIILLF